MNLSSLRTPVKNKNLFSFLFVTFFGLAACSTPNTGVNLTGKINILSPPLNFQVEDLPDDWVLNGELGAGSQVIYKSNVPALRLVNTRKNFVLSRRINANLQATPYLRWAWQMEQPQQGPHPIRLVIGLKGGPNAEDTEIGGSLLGFNIMNDTLPRHNRTLVINWGETALLRGARNPKKPDKYMLFTARGGRENKGQWLMEHIDISELYHRSWPEHDMSKIEIVFIGFSGVSGKPPSPAYFTGLQLSR